MTRSAIVTQSSGQIPVITDRAAPSSARRRLQLVLAGLWVLDGMLKLQPFMFTKDFAPMTLGAASDGAPSWLADPINWAKNLMSGHPVGLMIVFALVELAIGFAIAYRPTVRYGLLACMCWVPFLWFFAEGFGGLASTTAGPLTGAPGASILYGLLAVLLWPTDRPGGSEAVRFVGARAAKIGWVVVWGLLAALCFRPANTAADAVSDTISGNSTGTPTWYDSLLNHAANVTHGRGAEVSITLGVLLALVAVSVLVNDRRVVRAGLVLGIVLAALIWIFGEGFGMPYMGMATDPDTGPLLAVVAIAYWPVAGSLTTTRTSSASAQTSASGVSATSGASQEGSAA